MTRFNHQTAMNTWFAPLSAAGERLVEATVECALRKPLRRCCFKPHNSSSNNTIMTIILLLLLLLLFLLLLIILMLTMIH